MIVFDGTATSAIDVSVMPPTQWDVARGQVGGKTVSSSGAQTVLEGFGVIAQWQLPTGKVSLWLLRPEHPHEIATFVLGGIIAWLQEARATQRHGYSEPDESILYVSDILETALNAVKSGELAVVPGEIPDAFKELEDLDPTAPADV